jgi:cytochrome P450
VPSLTAESPLRPVVGRNSVLTAQGERHMRHRKLLLPAFHGEAIERHVAMITDVAEREIDRWPLRVPACAAHAGDHARRDHGRHLRHRGRPELGTPEFGVRTATKRLLAASTWPMAQVAELLNLGRTEPVGFTRAGLSFLDRPTYAVIAKRRSAGDLGERGDILSLLVRARTEGAKRSPTASCVTSC